jgi:uncharacterized membrane protein (UPF0127 family)
MTKKKKEVFVYNQTREAFLALRVGVADSFLGRLVGLLGRRSLSRQSGLWLVPGNSIHTIGMLFNIDVVFVDEHYRVVGLRELVRPLSITWPILRAKSLLELPAHTIFNSRTEIGDQLVIDRYEAAAVGAVEGADEKSSPDDTRSVNNSPRDWLMSSAIGRVRATDNR